MSEYDQEQADADEHADADTTTERDDDGHELTDAEQGVGVAPTQPGDPSDEHTAEGQGDTAFRPSSEDEEAAE